MRQIIGYIFVSLATFIVGLGAASPWAVFRTTSDSQAEREILRVERQYLNAHVERDAAALDRILADNFQFSHIWGRTSDKSERLALVENSNLAFNSIDTRDVEVVTNGDTATVRGIATVRGSYRDREFFTRPYTFMRKYEKRDGRWQIVSVNCGRYSSR